ncbi:MAG: potassium transporter TrkG, partial [Rubricella sp.]
MRGLRLPFLIVLVLVMCAAMIVPALHAAYLDDWKTARAFFYIAVMSGFVALCAGLALANRARTETPRRYLLTLMAAFLLLPILMALPIRVLVPSLSATSAYMEMVSAFTTSGATVFDRPDRVPASIHLWRGLVGWLGGYLSIVAALAIMSPLDIGGFELRSAVFGQGALTGRGVGRSGEAWERLKRAVLSVTPIYTGGTFLVFLGLAFAGQSTLDATIHAMSAVSTSGISATGQPVGATGGYLAEMVVACGLVVFATALIYDPARRREARPIWTDPELGLLLFIISVLPVLLFLRHWAGVLEVGGSSAAYNAFSALWGSFFTVLSFLSTSGFASIAWPEAQVWSGLQTPGLILLGLALVGGGVATTAGGVKL